MIRGPRQILIVALLIGVGGCSKWTSSGSSSRVEPAAEETPASAPAATDGQIESLTQELARLQAANERLTEENRTLRAKQEDLVFENQQMSKCLDDTRDVISERNELLQTAEKLRQDNMRLDQQVKDLQAQVTVLEKLLDEMKSQVQATPPSPAATDN